MVPLEEAMFIMLIYKQERIIRQAHTDRLVDRLIEVGGGVTKCGVQIGKNGKK